MKPATEKMLADAIADCFGLSGTGEEEPEEEEDKAEEKEVKKKLGKLKKLLPTEEELDEITLGTVWRYLDKQSQKNEELDFGKMWSTFMHGPKDDFPKYLEFAQSKMNYLPDDRIRKRLKMKFPKIMPVDVERVIKKVQVLRANRS